VRWSFNKACKVIVVEEHRVVSSPSIAIDDSPKGSWSTWRNLQQGQTPKGRNPEARQGWKFGPGTIKGFLEKVVNNPVSITIG